jgi:hypothetical protein
LSLHCGNRASGSSFRAPTAKRLLRPFIGLLFGRFSGRAHAFLDLGCPPLLYDMRNFMRNQRRRFQ